MSCILIIDDEEIVRTTVRKILEKAGHEVHEAANGKEGIRRFEAHRTDVTIVDILMPEKEGIETIIELKRNHPDLRAIAISGGGRTGNMDYLEAASKLGAVAILTKPFTKRELLDSVDKALLSAA